MTPFSLLGLRFTSAFLLLCLLFFRNLTRNFSGKDLLKGMLFGTCYFLVMVCEYTGLRSANTSTASFIENMAIVIVPLLNIPISRQLPSRRNMICVFLAAIGVGLLTLKDQGFSISIGELYLFGAAFFYALAIIVTNILSKEGNPLNMGIFQVGTIGVLGLLCSSATDTFILPQTPDIYLYIAALAIVCTGFGYTLQPVAQSKLNAETASIFCVVNPFVASLIGMFLLHETASPANIIGEILILIVLILH